MKHPGQLKQLTGYQYSEKGRIYPNVWYIVYNQTWFYDRPTVRGIIKGGDIDLFANRAKLRCRNSFESIIDAIRYEIHFFWVGLYLCYEYKIEYKNHPKDTTDYWSNHKKHWCLSNTILISFEKTKILTESFRSLH